MSKFYNNVKSRLNKKGLTGFVKTDYQEAAEHLGITDLDNVTTDQIIAGFKYLAAKRESQIQPIAPLTPQESPNQIQHHQEAETLAQQAVEESEIEPITPLEEQTEEGAIALPEENQIVVSSADKQALITTQSVALGFELSEQETAEIADTVDDVFSDYSAFLNGVTTAIKQYIDYKFDGIESTIENTTEDVRSHIAERTSQLNKKVENFSTNIKADIGGIRQNIKSSKAAILSRFALPAK